MTLSTTRRMMAIECQDAARGHAYDAIHFMDHGLHRSAVAAQQRSAIFSRAARVALGVEDPYAEWTEQDELDRQRSKARDYGSRDPEERF